MEKQLHAKVLLVDDEEEFLKTLSARLEMRGLAWVLLCSVTVAFACGAPLFLYLRERRLAELAAEASPLA